ncbi:hypothetical protein [Litoreibacter roseus]|uniref:hypothetical protein n=1 Tax=Litoreibacter roseus TaxID=2601869 RepID=UPI0013579B33|nr:hypothetical protein [Litoreibacter roseus]
MMDLPFWFSLAEFTDPVLPVRPVALFLRPKRGFGSGLDRVHFGKIRRVDVVDLSGHSGQQIQGRLADITLLLRVTQKGECQFGADE